MGGSHDPPPPAATANGFTTSPDPIDLRRLAAWWRPGPDWDRVVEQTDAEETPSHLNTVNSSGGFNAVSTDMLSVQYLGVQQHGHDVGAVQANCPAPTRRLVYYFEMTVKNAGLKGQMAIGFTPPGVKLYRQPGWEPNSCGYHGDDGFIYRASGRGESFGPKFTSGDTVGAGINYSTQEFFFTKNGELVGAVAKNVKFPMFPTISVHSQNEELTVNFGQHSFLFNTEAYESDVRRKQQVFIENMPLPVSVSHWIVRSYLLHYGYEETLTSFDTETRNALPPISLAQDNNINEQGDMFALNHRKILRQLIRKGDIDNVFTKLQEWYPQLLQNETSTMCFLLHCQSFIERMRAGNLEDAVKYARSHMPNFFSVKSLEPLLQAGEAPQVALIMMAALKPGFCETVSQINYCFHQYQLLLRSTSLKSSKDCIALLAYEDPSTSCVGHLLDMSQRDMVADAVNMMVLTTNPERKGTKNCVCSYLERLLRQLTACSLERRALDGEQGEAFYLHRALYSNIRRGKC